MFMCGQSLHLQTWIEYCRCWSSGPSGRNVERIQSLRGSVWSAGMLNILYFSRLFNLIALLSGLMGWDGALVVCFFMILFLEFVVLNHQWIPFFAGVRDVRQSLHYPSFPKMKFWRSNISSGVSILSSEGLRCDWRSCQSRNSVGTNDEVSQT